MPTYQYACTACAERLEAVQSFTDAPLTQCPACSGTLRKVFSPVGVVFKGSGFYKTDSRSRPNSGGPSEKGAGDGSGDKAASGASATSSGSSSTAGSASAAASSAGSASSGSGTSSSASGGAAAAPAAAGKTA